MEKRESFFFLDCLWWRSGGEEGRGRLARSLFSEKEGWVDWLVEICGRGQGLYFGFVRFPCSST